MTNGEKLKEIFPDIEFTDMAFTVHAVAEVTSNGVKGHISYDFWKEWWNAEYKEPSNSEKPNELVEERCPCYDCEHFEIKGWSYCKIHEDAYGDSRCNDYHKVVQGSNKPENPISSTAKNDLPHCQHTDEEIAKSFIEDVEAVKDQLPCGEQMDFPDTFDEFAEDYGFKDKDEVYTNGSELIPVFRVKQWLEHISITKNNLVPRNVVERIIKSPRTKEQMLSVLNSLPPQESIAKNDLGVDCISRADAIKAMQDKAKKLTNEDTINGLCGAVAILFDMPSVTSQEPVIRDNGVKNELESITKNCKSCEYYDLHYKVCMYCYNCSLWKEKQTTPKNNLEVDCISRADARSLVVKIGNKDILGMSGKAFQDLYKGIDDLPSVTPQEPKRGHWIDTSNGWMCSECNKDNTYDTNYCPNCGSYNGGASNGDE